MKHSVLIFLSLLLIAGSAWGKPNFVSSTTQGSFVVTVNFTADDLEDSDLIPVGGTCAVSFMVGGSDVVELYQVPTATTAASAGTIVGAAFSATTTEPYTFQPAQAGLKAVATTAAAGGSQMIIRCSNAQVSESGSGTGTLGYGDWAAMDAFETSEGLGLTDTGGSWWLEGQATAVCSSDGGGSVDLSCIWNGTGWVSNTAAVGGDNLGDHTATTDLLMGANDITLDATSEVGGVAQADLVDSSSATQTFGDGAAATVTHTYANTGTDVPIAYSTGAMAVTGSLTATAIGGIAEANLLDKSNGEAITGDYDFGGGGIEIESEEGRGTRVCLWLPHGHSTH